MTRTETRWVGEQFEHDTELGRLRALERVFDPTTVRFLDETVQVAPGWRCLELGAGAGSLTRWLADRVGPTGNVVAVDVNCRFLNDLPPHVDVVEGDVATMEFDHAFDLVHHRAVLAYVGGREDVLARAAQALAPGGWMLSEEPIFPSEDDGHRILGDTEDRVVARTFLALGRLLEHVGAAPSFGLRLPSLLEECGLLDVEQQGVVHVARGGSVHADLIWPLLSHLKPFLLEVGEIDGADVDRAVARFGEPVFSTMTPVLVSAWGRAPQTR
jgi:trans-aconitate methyltransferase